MNLQIKRKAAIMLMMVGIAISAFASQKDETSQYIPEYREGEVIVKFRQQSNVKLLISAASTSNMVDAVLKKIGANHAEQLMPLSNSQQIKKYRTVSTADDISNLYVIKFNGQSVEQAIESLKQLDEVEFAEPNYIVRAMGRTPIETMQTPPSIKQVTATTSTFYSDPMFNEQWGLQAINMPALWEKPIINSKRPVIAILDTGVDIYHPDLAANIWTNENEKGNDEDGNGYVGDVHGWNFVDNNADVSDFFVHGTHCAGIAAAVGNNGAGIVGANPDALIMPVKFMDNEGHGDIALSIMAIDYALANGADIISMSFGHSSPYPSDIEEAVLRMASNSAVLVAAAGNDNICMLPAHNNLHGSEKYAHYPNFPAAYEFVIGVMATNQVGELASFSNFDCDGPDNSTYKENYNYDVKAPGEYILSTIPDSDYAYMKGTSMACPMVAGAISRLLQSKEIADYESLRKTLILSDNGNVDMEKAYNITSEDINAYNIGEIFKADVNGVEMTFKITSPSTVQVGDGKSQCVDLYFGIDVPIVIPEEINGYKVTSIGGYAFSSCYYIPSIQIPSTITKIGEKAFDYCEKLESLFIPKEVEFIEEAAFSSCKSLESIVVEEGNPNYDSRNGCNAIIETKSNFLLFGCSSTIIPNTIVAIGRAAFLNSGITSIEIPSSLKIIGRGAFEGCEHLKVMNIPDGVETIEFAAFSRSGIETISISKTVNSIGLITPLPNLKSLTIAEDNPVYDSRNNCNAVIHTATNTLMYGYACSSIPESVTAIAMSAFYYAGITSLYIPKTVTNIGESAFMGNMLESLIVDEDNPVYDSRDNCNAIIETATNTFIFGTEYSTIPASVKHIGTHAFWGADISGDIIIPEGVETIGERAFYGQWLRKLVLPESIKQIDSYAFAYAHNLSTVYCHAKVPIDINYNVFSYGKDDEYAYSATLYVPVGSKTAYQQAEGWKEFANIEEFDPTGINQPAVEVENTNTPVYNILGQKVSGEMKGKKGIYIMKGKKVIVK